MKAIRIRISTYKPAYNKYQCVKCFLVGTSHLMCIYFGSSTKEIVAVKHPRQPKYHSGITISEATVTILYPTPDSVFEFQGIIDVLMLFRWLQVNKGVNVLGGI